MICIVEPTQIATFYDRYVILLCIFIKETEPVYLRDSVADMRHSGVDTIYF